MTLRTLNSGKYGIFLIMGNAGFTSSTVGHIQVLGWELGFMIWISEGPQLVLIGSR